jgi:signal transduction histidine kinase
MNGERSRLEADALMEMAVAIASGRPLLAASHRLLDLAVDLTHASRGAMISTDRDGHVCDVILSGAPGRSPEPGLPSVTAEIISGLLCDTRSTRLHGISLPSSSLGFPADHQPVTSLVGSQIRVLDRCYGCIYAADERGDQRFTGDDERLIEALAAQAGMCRLVENLREPAALMIDRVALRSIDGGPAATRSRLALQLHDDVVQTLFGIGMEIQAAALQVGEDELAARLQGAASNLDWLIDRLRHHDEGDAGLAGTGRARA